jgi:hypothetical protein
MKTLSNLIVVLLIIVGVVALIPIVSVGFALLCAGGFFLIWLLPILIIASSDETTKGEKACWILLIVFLSWFAWIFYFFLAPLKPRPRHYHYY